MEANESLVAVVHVGQPLREEKKGGIEEERLFFYPLKFCDWV